MPVGLPPVVVPMTFTWSVTVPEPRTMVPGVVVVWMVGLMVVTRKHSFVSRFVEEVLSCEAL